MRVALTGPRIVGGKISYPTEMSSEAKDLISKLCEVNPAKRLGNLSGGAADVKEHPWFKSTHWHQLYKREVNGPIIPRVSSNVSRARLQTLVSVRFDVLERDLTSDLVGRHEKLRKL